MLAPCIRILPKKEFLQCRMYHPRKLSKSDQKKIFRHTKPFVPIADHPLTEEWQKRPNAMKSYERLAWAKFGSSSAVNLRDLLPGKAEIREEWEAEKRWWMTLEDMQNAIKEEAESQERERQSYEKRVAENMSKMPKWIEQWEKDQNKQKELNEVQGVRRDAMLEKAMEHFDYKHAAGSQEIKEYVAEMRERERKEKKMMKKLSKGK